MPVSRGWFLAGVVSIVLIVVAVVSARPRVGAAGVRSPKGSTRAAVSADGRFVAFESTASNLVAHDTSVWRDVFVRDRLRRKTVLVSVSRTGKPGNSISSSPSISADGRFVFFTSDASNLVAGDTNQTWDVFVRDRLNGTTERVSVNSAGKQGDESSVGQVNSADGRFVAFMSYASNLVVGDKNFGTPDVFVRDRVARTTERVSVSTTGIEANRHSDLDAISPDGRFVVFSSLASNLVPADTNRQEDVFVRDRLTGTTERVSVNGGGKQGNRSSRAPKVSGDGRFVAFNSTASNLVAHDTNKTSDVFVRDRLNGTTERVSVNSAAKQAKGKSFGRSTTPDMRFVAFDSLASNLVPRDKNKTWDVFLRDRLTGTTELVSAARTKR